MCAIDILAVTEVIASGVALNPESFPALPKPSRALVSVAFSNTLLRLHFVHRLLSLKRKYGIVHKRVTALVLVTPLSCIGIVLVKSRRPRSVDISEHEASGKYFQCQIKLYKIQNISCPRIALLKSFQIEVRSSSFGSSLSGLSGLTAEN